MFLSVRVSNDHPTGVRYRAGVAFNREPQTVEVDEAQAAAIIADEYLDVEATLKDEPPLGIDIPPEDDEDVAAPPVEDASEVPAFDPASLSYKELQAYAKGLGLSAAGNREAILARL